MSPRTGAPESSAPSCTRTHLASWEQLGEGAPLDAALALHLESCSECATEHDAIVDVRERLQALPVRRIGRDRLDAIRFQLVAAARRSGDPVREPAPAPPRPSARPAAPPARRRSLQLVALLAAAMGLWVAVVLLWRGGPAPSAAPATIAAEIELADGANGLRAQDGPDEVFSLVDGTARFRVRHLRPGERFRVVTGGDTVEVRGTMFTVTAEHGRASAVDVQEGTVVLTLVEGSSWVLTAGQSWRRPPAVGSSAAATGSGGPVEDTPPPAPAPARTAEPKAPEHAASAPGHPAPTSTGEAPKASSSAASSASAAADERTKFDAEFQRAMDLLRKGRASEAAASFDALRASPAADSGRSVDALYWAARAHAAAGQSGAAEERARRVVETQPGSWHADDAALMLGEAMLRRGDAAGARPWLERAARSPRESVRTRAARALDAPAANPAP